MNGKRLLLTGYTTPQLTRHVEYALDLGATVLHAGYRTVHPVKPPAGYIFTPIAQDATPGMRLRHERGQAYQELVGREAQRLRALVDEFRPDLCHTIGID